jgi:hypothetical protein
MMQQFAEMNGKFAETKAESTLMREQFSAEISAMKSAHADEKEGSAVQKLQDWRRKEEAKYEEPNFRHQVKKAAAEEEVSVSYFKKRLSNDTFMNIPTSGSTIVRSITNIDPQKSGVLLTYLDMQSIYKWQQDMRNLQKKHPHEELQWGLFVSSNLAFRLNAYNDARKFIPVVIIDGTTLNITNEQLNDLILDIALPKSEGEFIETFKRMVKFRRLKGNLHECSPDSAKYDEWYDGILQYSYEANEVVDLLTSVKEKRFCPILKTFSGKAGLMQIFYEGIPMQAGRNIHDALEYSKVSLCTNLREYTILFQVRNQKLMDDSDIMKLNRSYMNKRDFGGMDSSKKDITLLERWPSRKEPVDTGKNKMSYDKYNNNNNNNNNNNRQLIPYNNSHNNRVNNIFNNADDEFVDNVNDTEVDYTDNHDYNPYDFDEVFGQRPDHIEGDNPYCNVTNTLSYIDKRESKSDKDRPCWLEINGECTSGRDCRFSHNSKILQEEWTIKNAKLQGSRYKPSSHQQHPSFSPKILQRGGAPLRSLGTLEEDQVGSLPVTNPNLSYINNSNRGFFTPPATAHKPTQDQEGRREGNYTV